MTPPGSLSMPKSMQSEVFPVSIVYDLQREKIGLIKAAGFCKTKPAVASLDDGYDDSSCALARSQALLAVSQPVRHPALEHELYEYVIQQDVDYHDKSHLILEVQTKAIAWPGAAPACPTPS